MSEQVLREGNVAVVTGAASGIGLAAASRFASMGMKVCLVDIAEDALAQAAVVVGDAAAEGPDAVLVCSMDVGEAAQFKALKTRVYDRFGQIHLLMNNAATRSRGTALEDMESWRDCFNVNLYGVIEAVQAFFPAMLAQGNPCMVVNTGSKQGITNPPGNLSYNASKAALKCYTEGLQHELRNLEGCRISAHLLVPGWTTTGKRRHQPGAWLPNQVIDRLLDGLQRGDFYIICPDDEVSTEIDHARFLWATEDMTANRPPLSRWHTDYQDSFSRWQKRHSGSKNGG